MRANQTWWFTHDRLRKAYRLLERLSQAGTLFTYLRTEFTGLDIAATTNRIEGGTNAQLLRGLPPGGLKQKIRPGEPERIFFFCAPKGIRTPDLLFRRQTLYPAELWAHSRLLENFSLPEPRITLREPGPSYKSKRV